MKLIIQMPCYNEEETLTIALNALPRHIDGIDEIEYLIINDGSQDKTEQIAKDWGVNYVVHFKRNLGLAKGFLAGIDLALINGADIAQQLLALFRHRDAGASPVKDPKPHFFLHRLDGMGQAGLGDIELFCSLADGRALGHRQQISDFFQRHIDFLSMRR